MVGAGTYSSQLLSPTRPGRPQGLELVIQRLEVVSKRFEVVSKPRDACSSAPRCLFLSTSILVPQRLGLVPRRRNARKRSMSLAQRTDYCTAPYALVDGKYVWTVSGCGKCFTAEQLQRHSVWS